MLHLDLNLSLVCAKWIPRELTEKQMNRRLQCATAFLARFRTIDKMNSIVTGDETWIYYYDPETKRQSSQWTTKGCRSTKFLRNWSTNKLMAIIFFDIHGILYCNLVPPGQTVNSIHYTDILKKSNRVIKKRTRI